MIKDALQYLIGLKETEVLEIDGHTYTTKRLEMVDEPSPAPLKTKTLTSLVDYLKSQVDVKASKHLIIHIVSPTCVSLQSELRKDKDRENYMLCEVLLPSNINYGRFMEVEQFNIMLQSSFVDTADRRKLLKVTGTITDKAVKEVGDDGVSQAVTIKTGVATVNDVLVPNPVILAPYRTFPEIEQPESAFIFRMQSGPTAALFEADGGAWRNEAMAKIKKYLQEELKTMSFIKIIS
ncbi:hypothetical protein SAMN02745975_00550 [Geosporobacter subterraneus DSM 17957]|uniref:Phage protein n=1 Tax=Geosporobacter subterraneus DSM 17957 TaxID=1121919 RepID=A0A1M6DRT9_9FIRM|nr:hypothetical protein [Geosporobacter subterraneus]SHI75893.1 hypothetical protein SAMN02745975_00550 [Geosporobacter subterraneus DSM 17957]